jgi:hypothetical protein
MWAMGKIHESWDFMAHRLILVIPYIWYMEGNEKK